MALRQRIGKTFSTNTYLRMKALMPSPDLDALAGN
jgi:hypothetical protein